MDRGLAAAIGAVSNATFASASFVQSLQSVLDKLGLAAADGCRATVQVWCAVGRDRGLSAGCANLGLRVVSTSSSPSSPTRIPAATGAVSEVSFKLAPGSTPGWSAPTASARAR